ncbi:MAG: Superoxide dismutase [Fe], partial [uncultured Acetobacteraceae bacterium]
EQEPQGQVARRHRGRGRQAGRRRAARAEPSRAALEPLPVLAGDVAQGRRREPAAAPGRQDRPGSRRLPTIQGGLQAGRRDAVRLRLGVACHRRRRQAEGDEDAQRRQPALHRRRPADPRRGRVGALLLPRLPQPAAELPRQLPGQAGGLGEGRLLPLVRRHEVRPERL